MKYLLIILFLISGIPEKEYDISLNLQVGKVYYQTIKAETDFLTTFNGQEMLVSTITEARLSYEVVGIQDSFYNLQVQYERISMVNKSPMATYETSSETEDSTNMMSGLFRGMVGKPFTAVLDKKGMITEIGNVDTLYSGIWDGKAAEMISSKGEVSKELNDQIGTSLLLGNFELLSAFYPRRHVVIGEAWRNSTQFGKRLAGTTENKFTLIDISKKGIFIEGVSETFIRDEGANMEIMGKEYQYDLDGSVIFNCKMDYRTGWIDEATIKQDFKGELTIVADEKGNNTSIPVAVSTVITITK